MRKNHIYVDKNLQMDYFSLVEVGLTERTPDMLSQFTVKNFKSIRDEMTFDFQAAAISEHIESLIVGKDGENYLPISAIYGPNGAGKSNVLEAINSLISLVVRPILAINPSNNAFLYNNAITPFKFSDETEDAPTEYKMFFSTETAEYCYVLKIKDGLIIFESLDRIKFTTKRKSALYLRDEQTITLKGDVAGLKLNEAISQSLPLITYFGITYKNHPIISDVMDWFMNRIVYLSFGLVNQTVRLYIHNNEKLKGLILSILKEMDIDVTDYRIKKEDENSFQIYTQHIVDGKAYELYLSDESTGTIKVFELLPIIASGLLNGQTIIIDELDSRLHPLLLKYIIGLFADKNINKKGAQLIFTSHDMSTLNNEVFRRDEVWFVAKGNEQNTKLYSLVEFKSDKGESVRKDAKYDKQYLEGKYGADPYLKTIIDWSEPNA